MDTARPHISARRHNHVRGVRRSTPSPPAIAISTSALTSTYRRCALRYSYTHQPRACTTAYHNGGDEVASIQRLADIDSTVGSLGKRHTVSGRVSPTGWAAENRLKSSEYTVLARHTGRRGKRDDPRAPCSPGYEEEAAEYDSYDEDGRGVYRHSHPLCMKRSASTFASAETHSLASTPRSAVHSFTGPNATSASCCIPRSPSTSTSTSMFMPTSASTSSILSSSSSTSRKSSMSARALGRYTSPLGAATYMYDVLSIQPQLNRPHDHDLPFTLQTKLSIDSRRDMQVAAAAREETWRFDSSQVASLTWSSSSASTSSSSSGSRRQNFVRRLVRTPPMSQSILCTTSPRRMRVDLLPEPELGGYDHVTSGGNDVEEGKTSTEQFTVPANETMFAEELSDGGWPSHGGSDGEEPERERWRRVRAVQLHVQTRLWRTKKEVSTLLWRHRSDVSDVVGIGSTRSRE